LNPWCFTKYLNEGIVFPLGFGMLMQYNTPQNAKRYSMDPKAVLGYLMGGIKSFFHHSNYE
jgi:hypothetical protein